MAGTHFFSLNVLQMQYHVPCTMYNEPAIKQDALCEMEKENKDAFSHLQ